MKKQINNYRSYLSEVTRKDIVGKSKQQSKPRYSKSSDYKPALRPSDINIDIKTLLRSGQLVIQILQQGENDYICTIAYDGFLDELKKAVGMQEKPYVNLNTIITVMRKSIDNSDVYVDCTCPDFVYRFAFWATKYGYKYGYKQNTPPKYNKTNMYDNNGAVCKHLLGTIREKDKLVVKASTVLNNAIKKYPNDFRKALGMNTDDFIVNNRAGRRINTRNTIADDSSDIDNMEDAFWATH